MPENLSVVLHEERNLSGLALAARNLKAAFVSGTCLGFMVRAFDQNNEYPVSQLIESQGKGATLYRWHPITNTVFLFPTLEAAQKALSFAARLEKGDVAEIIPVVGG